MPILGFKPEELIGKNLLTYIHPLDLPAISAKIAAGLTKPNVQVPVTYRFKHKNGTWRVLDAVGINLLSDPLVEGLLIFSRDVTDAQRGKEAEKHVAELERINKLMVGRESRIAELKEQNAKLQKELDSLKPS
jgi:PAS domain S-box-containing protein